MLEELRINVEAGMEDEVFLTDNIEGEIISVLVDYDENVLPQASLTIKTMDNEKILNIQGNKDGVYYPRNSHVQSQKYSEKVVEDRGAFVERWNVFGPLMVIFTNSELKSGKVSIKILINR